MYNPSILTPFKVTKHAIRAVLFMQEPVTQEFKQETMQETACHTKQVEPDRHKASKKKHKRR